MFKWLFKKKGCAKHMQVKGLFLNYKNKNCTVCGVEYVPRSGISKYCPACAKKIQREKSNESKRRSRERNRQACIELSAKNDRLIWNSRRDVSFVRVTRMRR